ncbi:MAG TPA: packaged DNA stabilization gp4 family protein [Steroidobacter sp.]
MSVTNLQIIADALRSIGVLDETETPSSEQGSHCLRELNQMLAAWDVEGVKLGYFAQTSTAATCPIPDWAEAAVKYRLALRVAPHYGAQVPIGTVAAADESYTTLLRTVMNLKLTGADLSHLPIGSGHYNAGYDIRTDNLL